MKKLFLIVYIFTVALLLYKFILVLRFSYLFPLLLPLVYLTGKGVKSFLIDWSPFYFVLFLYDLFHGVNNRLIENANTTILPSIEKTLFMGQIPNVWLQQELPFFLTGFIGVFLTLFYLGHYLLPTFFFFHLWLYKKQDFHKYMIAFLILSSISFVTFYFFPAYPPWLASEYKIIPPIQKALTNNLSQLSLVYSLPDIFNNLRANLVAPFPSLHAAFPFLFFLISKELFSQKIQYLLLINTILVSFTLVLFGEHYVIDVIGGYTYAYFSLKLSRQVIKSFNENHKN